MYKPFGGQGYPHPEGPLRNLPLSPPTSQGHSRKLNPFLSLGPCVGTAPSTCMGGHMSWSLGFNITQSSKYVVETLYENLLLHEY